MQKVPEETGPRRDVNTKYKWKTLRKHLNKSAEGQRFVQRQCGLGGQLNRDASRDGAKLVETCRHRVLSRELLPSQSSQ